MIKLLHIGDTHFLNNDRHDEYYHVLKQLEDIKDIDYVIHAGDLMNSKSVLSPESVKIASWFIRMLSNIAKKQVLIVPGNHDLNEKNNNRLDAVSSIANSLNLPNVYVPTKSEIIEFDDVVILNYSILDKDYEFDLDDKQKLKPIVGIYHGALNGSTTDIGYKFVNNNNIDFSQVDVCCLADIHKFQIISTKPLAIYCGSQLQQNFGESEDKGAVIWTIKSKTDIKYERILLDNPYLFKTIKLSDYDISKIKSDWKIRFVNDINDNNLFDKAKKELDSKGFNLKSLIKTDLANKNNKLDLNNIKTLTNLNKVIKEKYTDKYDQYKDDLTKINEYYYNKVVNSEISSGNWTLKTLKWDNLFNFSEKNILNLEDYKNNILLINGPNYSGKSSLISCITFAIFGSWTKSPAKYSDYVNSTKDNANSYVELEKNGKLYSIERDLTLTKKTFKNSVKFTCITDNKNLNGDDINETEKTIEKYFGTLDNFKLTTLITQFDNLGFINEKSTKRKEILNQFVSLDFFKIMESAVDKDLSDAKLKYNINLESLKNNEDYKLIDIDILNDKNLEYQNKITNKLWNTDKFSDIISNYQKNIKNIGNSKEIEIIQSQNENLLKEVILHENKIKEIKEDIEEISKFNNEQSILFNISGKRKELLDKNTQLTKSLISNVPCNFEYTDCQFIKNSINNKNIIIENEQKIKQYDIELENFKGVDFNLSVLKEKEYKQNILLLERDISRIKKDIERNISKINSIKIDSDVILITQIEYENALKEKQKIQQEQNDYFNENQIILFQINQYNKSKEKYEELEKETDKLMYKYNLLLDYHNMIGKNGLPLFLINNYIKSISDIVSEIVSSILDLEVKLEINENKFNIYIKNSKEKDYRIIECGSGAEHFFVGLAIRLAFYKISNLVKSTLLIMDEPATSLDVFHQNKFGDFFEVLNIYFDNVIVVTHLELLKTYTTKVLDLENVDNFAKLVQNP